VKPNPHHGLPMIPRRPEETLPAGYIISMLLSLLSLLLAATTASMTVASPDFKNGGPIPAIFASPACGGENRTPRLIWQDPPKGTKSFALVVHDPDAPRPGGFYHWIVYDLPASARSLGAGTARGRDGRNSAGETGYLGPCPPPGPAHHYVFSLYALDVSHVAGRAPLDAPGLEQRIRGHVLARAVLAGTFAY
jgi:Raf kinase inhibitor-like YbhB/YbcL family protein